MKTLIRKTAIAATLLLTFAATFQAKAQDETLIYKKAYNSAIGITVDNATGASYMVKDQQGNVVLQGTVKSTRTFFIPTAKLAKGTYRFMIGSLVLQEFVIQ